MAVCDYKYKILYADFGSYGHESDAGIFDRCDFKKALDRGGLNLPGPALLPNTNVNSPFFFIGDSAFR
uniref:DDE Tnp4 domain-containing protein n=1 Tax=Ditylenchus dipsaci TaxID=166011 RepID=A0A915CSA3_9BILA